MNKYTNASKLPDPEDIFVKSRSPSVSGTSATAPRGVTSSPVPVVGKSGTRSGYTTPVVEYTAARPAVIGRDEILRVEPTSAAYNIKFAEMTSVLSRAYAQQIKPCLDQIARLRGLGFEKELRLPSIVVIGDQSSGKSSVLELLSGVAFPRGTGVVTLCPLQLSMRTRDDLKWKGHIRYFDNHGKEIQWEIESPDEVEDAINEAQSRITGNQKSVSNNIIEMTIENSNLPNLTLIDLPGIARYNHGGEKNFDVHKMTTDIIREYIYKEEVIILAVIPLTADTATMEALQLAREADPHGKRTIGVLTFPDLVNRGAEDEKLMIARNLKYPLAKGFITVKCRNQEDIKNRKTLNQARHDESNFFANDPFFNQLDPTTRGSDMLAKRLSEEMLQLIKNFIPEVVTDVQAVRERLARELEDMGHGPPEDDRAKVALIARMFHDFVKLFEAEAMGRLDGDKGNAYQYEKLPGNRNKNLHQKCRGHWRKLADDIEQAAINLGDNDQLLRKDIREFIAEERGRELPNFYSTYPIVESIVRNQLVKPLRNQSFSCLRDVNLEVDSTIRHLADIVFSKYPKLDIYIKESIQQRREELYQLCRQDVEKMFEQETYVWTVDRTYLTETRSRETVRTLSRQLGLPVSSHMYSFCNHFGHRFIQWVLEQNSRKDSSDNNSKDFPAWCKEHFSDYFDNEGQHATEGKQQNGSVSSVNDEDLSSNQEIDHLIEKCMIAVHSYIKVAVTRIMDNAPLSMMHFMLYKLAEDLRNEVTIYQKDSETLEELLEEKEGLRARRLETKNRLKALQEAESELSRISL